VAERLAAAAVDTAADLAASPAGREALLHSGACGALCALLAALLPPPVAVPPLPLAAAAPGASQQNGPPPKRARLGPGAAVPAACRDTPSPALPGGTESHAYHDLQGAVTSLHALGSLDLIAAAAALLSELLLSADAAAPRVGDLLLLPSPPALTSATAAGEGVGFDGDWLIRGLVQVGA
jgi:hypothetical protein